MKTIADGEEVEVAVDVLRQDIRTQLPQLRELDGLLQAATMSSVGCNPRWCRLRPRVVQVPWVPAPATHAGGAGALRLTQ